MPLRPQPNRRDCLHTALKAGLGLSVGAWPATWAASAPGSQPAASTTPAPTATPTAEQPFWRLAREGGNIFLMRHAQTVSGIGDPPGFRLDDCSTQRNLSPAGVAESQRLGERFVQQRVQLHEVKSSAWCRCTDTARHAFDPHYPAHQVWAPLNSFFQGQGSGPVQTRQAMARARQLPPGHNWMWVTHQVNISALTGRSTSMGEVLLCRLPTPTSGQLVVLASLRI
jgi:broad specificity phosphatase PhoE